MEWALFFIAAGGIALGALMGILIGVYLRKRKPKDQIELENLKQTNQDLKKALDVIKETLDEKKTTILDFKFQNFTLEKRLEKEKRHYHDLLRQKKSSEIRVGLIGEQIAPFLDAWPFDTKNFKFLGAPIDGISFEENEMVVIEIKTGHSRLSPSQRRIKKQIKEGRVKFMEFRIEEDGYRCKTD